MRRNNESSAFKSKSGRKEYIRKALIDGDVPTKSPKCKSFDFLGEPVTFNYKGSQDYETTFGAFCSLLVVIVILVYLINSLILFALQTPLGVMQTVHLQQQASINPWDLGFRFAVGF
jgi:hypothetical protein